MKQSNLARIFKALSNEQRLSLFMMIYKNCLNVKKGKQSCCGTMEKAFTAACCKMDLSRSTISHHLKELQNAGLINTTRKGQSFSCGINEPAIKAIKEFLK